MFAIAMAWRHVLHPSHRTVYRHGWQRVHFAPLSIQKITIAMTKVLGTAAVLILGLTVTATSSAAQDRAVSELNAEASVDYEWAELGYSGFDDDLTTLGGNVAVYAPVGKYFGAFVWGRLERSEFEYEDGDSSRYDTNHYSIGGFIRRSDLGAFALSARGWEFEGRSSKVQEDFYGALLAVYGKAFTLSTDVIFDTNNEGEAGTAQATWYVRPNVLLGISTGILDMQQSYSVFAESQIGDSGFSYGALLFRDESWFPYDSARITLSYRFAKPKTLMARYRNDLMTLR